MCLSHDFINLPPGLIELFQLTEEHTPIAKNQYLIQEEPN